LDKEIRSPKFEIRNNFQNPNDQNSKQFEQFEFGTFEFVSNFDIRISDFLAQGTSKGCNYPLEDGPASYQLVGRVMAYQGDDG